jgi:hypothetical protein
MSDPQPNPDRLVAALFYCALFAAFAFVCTFVIVAASQDTMSASP